MATLPLWSSRNEQRAVIRFIVGKTTYANEIHNNYVIVEKKFLRMFKIKFPTKRIGLFRIFPVLRLDGTAPRFVTYLSNNARTTTQAVDSVCMSRYPDIRIYPLILWQPKIRIS